MMLSIHLLSLTNSTTRSCRPHIDPFPLSLSLLCLCTIVHDRLCPPIIFNRIQGSFLSTCPHDLSIPTIWSIEDIMELAQSLIEYCQIFFQAILLLYPSFPSRTNVTNPMWRHLLTLWIRKIRIVKYRSIFPRNLILYIYISFLSKSFNDRWMDLVYRYSKRNSSLIILCDNSYLLVDS